MAERPQFGSQSISDQLNLPTSPECGRWETLLVDAMDGTLVAESEEETTFVTHMAGCAACTAMFEQVRRGREWLEFLAPEPVVPAHLLESILKETGRHKHGMAAKAGISSEGNLAVAGGDANVLGMYPAWQRPGFADRLRRFAEPRLLMTAAMAFFSIALTLSLTGVRISRANMADMRPNFVRSILEKRIMTASTPIVRYYDHLRFVYEVESRVREMRRSTEAETPNSGAGQTPGGNGNQPQGESKRKDGGSRLIPAPEQNPGLAPEQTVNPPASVWGGDELEAESGHEAGIESGPEPGLEPDRDSIAGSDLVQTSALSFKSSAGLLQTSWIEPSLLETGLLQKSVFEVPGRSQPCLA